MVAPDYAADSSIHISERGRNALVCQPCVDNSQIIKGKNCVVWGNFLAFNANEINSLCQIYFLSACCYNL